MPPAKKAARKSAKKSSKKSTKLSKKQVNQRKYAAAMKGVRKRAKTTTGGKGLIKKRSTATTLRKKLGLSEG